MFRYQAVVFSAFLTVSWCTEDWTFPPGFKFGAASSAYQVEGAWNVGGKGESIWDRFAHTKPELFEDNANGDVACDSYNLWETDIQKAAEIGLHHYRFSISWPRLLPTGFANNISEDGARYYNNLINGLLEKGIEPLVTLYHWDLPQSLQDLGGWTNPLIADWFAGYARVAFSLYGDRVKMWLTINEPIVMCDLIYSIGVWAPSVLSPDHGVYLCNKFVLIAHAKAYRVYDEEFRAKYNGELSIANLLFWFDPNTEDDEERAEIYLQNCAGRYSHAIYSKEGGWPPVIEKIMAENSKQQGYAESTLPAFTQEEIELVRGTFDYYAMNYYYSDFVSVAEDGEISLGWPLRNIPDHNSAIDWRQVVPKLNPIGHVFPEGMRRHLNWLRNRYGDMRFVIAENGLATMGGLEDQDRIDHVHAHLKQVLLATKEDGINLTHYTVWSLFDNFEWTDGYRTKLGLYEVNFTDPLRTRTPRDSARYYASVIKNHALPVE